MARCKTLFEVSIQNLLDCGALQPGEETLCVEARGKVRIGDLQEDGSILFEGKRYTSPSSFAVAALRSAGAKNRTTANGWQIVIHKNKTLETYRREYFLDMKASKSEQESKESQSLPESSIEAKECPDSAQLTCSMSGPESSASESPSFPSFDASSPFDTTHEGVKGCSDLSSCSRITGTHLNSSCGKKREPLPELHAWLRQALKKRHVDALTLAGTLQ